MNPNLKLSNLRTGPKLLMMSLTVWTAFILILGIIVFSFTITQSRLTDIAEKDMGRVIVNSQTTREISELFTDINLLSHDENNKCHNVIF